MDGARTRGHPIALAAIEAMIRGRAPHAVLLVGPQGIGKTTLALDLAAGLLCTAEPEARPCRTCQACRLVERGTHPDLHRLGPEGPGRQVVIGGPDSKFRGVRDLIVELALRPAMSDKRVAIIEAVDRMNEDAQAALLKTLEEPPSGVTIVLSADAMEPLLPTIRSRCAILRLGPVPIREVEMILSDAGIADPPLGARLARISGGRPGVAVGWAKAPDSLLIRDELSRALLDLGDARPSARLAAIRAAHARARDVVASRVAPTPQPESVPSDTEPDADDPDDETSGGRTKVAASDRRRAAQFVVDLWTSIARDLALIAGGLDGSVRELALLDELTALARGTDAATWGLALDRLGGAAVLLAGNVAPELVIDDLALAWPRRATRAS